MDIVPQFSPVNALWSLALFGIVFWKIRRLRQEVVLLASSLRNIGDPFIHRDLQELKKSVQQLTARVAVTEGDLKINGSEEQG
jgi:hypothetical protein